MSAIIVCAVITLAFIYFGHYISGAASFVITLFLAYGLVLNVKKYGSYKAYKEEMHRIQEEKLKKIAIEKQPDHITIAEAPKTIVKPARESLQSKRYKELQIAAERYAGLFYPLTGDFEFPSGYHNIPTISYVAYDLETTGLTPTHDEILEIGAIRVVNGKITGVFHEYIRPTNTIPEDVTRINGITDEMVKDCRMISDVLPEFIEFTERLPMIAHNAEFDYSFIKKAWFKIKGKNFSRKHYCTMKIYKKYYKELMLHNPLGAKLTDAVKEILGVQYYQEFINNNHRALVDASAVQAIYEMIGGVINTN